MITPDDWYEILQVSPNADPEVIHAAYKRLAHKWHPDRRPGDASASDRMKLLNEAYEVLSNPGKRKQYDTTRAAKNGAQKAGISNSTTNEQYEPSSPSAPAQNQHDGDVNSRTSGQGSPKPTMSPLAWCLFAIGLVLFLMDHGPVLFTRPLLFLLTCLVWGAIFGSLAYGCIKGKKRIGVIVVATLFALAAALDVGVSAYGRAIYVPLANQPQTDKTPRRSEPQPKADVPAVAMEPTPTRWPADGPAWATKFFAGELSHDFGKVPWGRSLTHKFTITNIYDVPFVVAEARTSSDSFNAVRPTGVIPSRGSAVLEVTAPTLFAPTNQTVTGKIYVRLSSVPQRTGDTAYTSTCELVVSVHAQAYDASSTDRSDFIIQ